MALPIGFGVVANDLAFPEILFRQNHNGILPYGVLNERTDNQRRPWFTCEEILMWLLWAFFCKQLNGSSQLTRPFQKDAVVWKSANDGFHTINSRLSFYDGSSSSLLKILGMLFFCISFFFLFWIKRREWRRRRRRRTCGEIPWQFIFSWTFSSLKSSNSLLIGDTNWEKVFSLIVLVKRKGGGKRSSLVSPITNFLNLFFSSPFFSSL